MTNEFRTFAVNSFLCGRNVIENAIMRKIFLWSSVLLTVSCGLEEVSRRPDGNTGDVWIKPGAVGSSDPSKTITYITAFDYPDGYDWRRDEERGSVKCSLVVFAGAVPVMKVPVGDAYEVSSDPDMHRMVKGHLFTDFSTDSETVIKKDGKEIIRYEGREVICGLVEKDGDVYTLGHKRSGKGFAYRKNGEIVLERGKGCSFGELHEDGDSISFAFREPVDAVGESLERYYVSVNGKVSQTAVREDVRKVWDAVFHKGEICYLASVIGISSPVLFRSGEMKTLNMPESSRMLTCRILRTDEYLFAEGLCKRDGKPLTSGLWREDGQVYLFSDGMSVSSVCMGGDGVCCVLNSSSSSGRGIIYRCGEIYPMPQDYVSVGNSPSIVIDGILHVGLSSISGTYPLIWKDGEVTPLKINGFISTISTNK